MQGLHERDLTTNAPPRKRTADATRSSGRTPDGEFRVRRFDADRRDEVIDLEVGLRARPTQRQLLWIDAVGPIGSDDAKRIAERFDLDARTRQALVSPGDRPHLALHGQYIHLRVAAEPSDKQPGSSPWLDVVAAGNVVITHHLAPIGFLDDIDERIEADTPFGELDAASFVATLLDEAITSYFRAVDAIEDDVDDLDGRSLRDDGRSDLLDDLVALRRRIARLRRLLAEHRALFAALAAADVAVLTGDAESAEAFRNVSSRFDSAMGAVEDSRDVLLGSFDVYMTRTAQRTNDVMKVLALATVLLLPGSLVAGLLGMNVTVPLSKDDPTSFWIVVGGVALFAMAILGLARARRWL